LEGELGRSVGHIRGRTGADHSRIPDTPRFSVEAAVLIIERWLLARLRHQLNEVRPIRRLGVTRRTLLEELDRPHLKQLPSEPYAFAEWRLRRVSVDYHGSLL
jgi:hypothetical protein